MRAVNYLLFPSSRAKKRKVVSDTYFVSARVKYCYVPKEIHIRERERERRTLNEHGDQTVRCRLQYRRVGSLEGI